MTNAKEILAFHGISGFQTFYWPNKSELRFFKTHYNPLPPPTRSYTVEPGTSAGESTPEDLSVLLHVFGLKGCCN